MEAEKTPQPDPPAAYGLGLMEHMRQWEELQEARAAMVDHMIQGLHLKFEWEMGLLSPLQATIYCVGWAAVAATSRAQLEARPWWVKFRDDFWMPRWSTFRHDLGHRIAGRHCDCDNDY